MKARVIYLDNNASTPIDSRVLDVMTSVLRDVFANPSSTTHALGRYASGLVEESRASVGALINAEPHEIVFTSGATESNNLAILGLADAAPVGARAITCAIEHKSVLGPFQELQRRGVAALVLGVDRRGRLSMDRLEAELRRERPFLVSIQAANSEIGTRQDISAIVEIAHEYGAAVHCDATQAVGKIPVDVIEWGVDFLSFNAHKLNGPKGIGALFIATGPQNWPLKPLMFGGNQEFGLRPGTLDVPAIAGFGAAAKLGGQATHDQIEGIAAKRDRFESHFTVPGLARVNGDTTFRLPGTTSLTLLGADAEQTMVSASSLALSMTSACNGSAPEASHVLLALGLPVEEALCTIRASLTINTTEDEISVAVRELLNAIAMARVSSSIGF